jgi:hypothetical protein
MLHFVLINRTRKLVAKLLNFNLNETDFWQIIHQLFTVWATFTEIVMRMGERTLTTLV